MYVFHFISYHNTTSIAKTTIDKQLYPDSSEKLTLDFGMDFKSRLRHFKKYIKHVERT